MKTKLIKILFFLLIGANYVVAQSKLVMNGAIINITSGANLVINATETDAITRNSGHIISEGEDNKIVWNMSTNSGLYEIPFGFGASDYIPVSFTKNAGVGSGSFEFSTYRTSSWFNSGNLPSVITNLNNLSGSDNSAFVINRFWQVNAVNYSTKPDLTNLAFNYLDDEYNSGSNTISENNLQAQSWSTTTNSWTGNPVGLVDIALNTVTVNSVVSSDLNPWWTLVDKSSPLPVKFMELVASCNDGAVELEWTTASEINNDYFSVERSPNGEKWENILTIPGSGNSSQIMTYSVNDKHPLTGKSYYRIRQSDFDGKSDYSQTISSECSETKGFSLSVYPNPSNGLITLETTYEITDNPVSVEIIDIYGKVVENRMLFTSKTKIDISNFAKGIYMLKAIEGAGEESISKKLTIQ